MKLNRLLLNMALAFAGSLFANLSVAQCPTITCPGNVAVNHTPGTCGAVVNYTVPVGTNPCGIVSQTFNYTGSAQTFTVPAGVTTVTLEAWGAQGSNSGCVGGGGGSGANGGYVKADYTVTPGQVLTVYVGSQAGYNGGGMANCCPAAGCVGGNGGGASDVRSGGVAFGNRIMVAGAGGGGGGGSANYSGGNGGTGGGLAANAGTNSSGCGPDNGGGGGGGTQLAGGAAGCGGTYPNNCYYNGFVGMLGIGGDGNASDWKGGGGGGGGYYGGGGGGSYCANGGGGGGSSYTAVGAANVVHTAGIRSGNGQVIVTYSGGGATTTQTAGLASGATFPVGVTTNTFTVNDGLGNTANCSFTVTVTDNQNPVITAPANITVNTDAGVCGAVVNFNTPVGTDNCVVTTARTTGLASGSTFPVGTTTQTYVATDASGHTATATFTVTVTDNENPVLTAPANITVNTDAGLCGAVVNFNTPAGTDNCAVTTALTAGLASGSTFPVGTTTQTYVATDASGNTATVSFTVTVTDNELPVVTVPANVTSCNPVVTNIAPVVTDNCSVSSITYTLTGATTGNGNTDASGSTFNTGITSVTYTATDVNGNTSSSTFNVVVNTSYNNNATASICQGKSILLGGAQQTQAGTYVDQYTTALGCDSIVTTVLTVNPLPTVDLAAFVTDSVCVTVAPIALPAGTPSGGSYSGLGVVGNNFNPNAAGVGIRTIVYTYADLNGCQNSDSTKITVLLCTGIDENTKFQPVVYPNPANEQVTINLGATYKAVEISVLELNGRIVMTNRYNYTNKVTSDISGLSTGMYFLQIKADGQNTMVKVVKN